MEPVRSRASLLIIFIIFALIFFGGGFLAGREFTAIPQGNPLELRKVQQVYQELQNEFFFKEGLDPEILEYGAVKGFVNAVGDPYTYFLNPEENKEFEEVINGSFEGIGAEIGLNEQREIIIIAPLEGAPAKRAGLQPQDVLLQIDQHLTVGITLDEAVKLIRGPKGSTVNLLVGRSGLPDPIRIPILRDVIEIPILKWELRNTNIAYIQLFNFHERAAQTFEKAAKQILNSGARSIILDLRGNPGGILQEAVAIGGWFIEKGSPVALERFGNGEERTYESAGPATLRGFPLVILIDKGSASASEILAGALKVHNNAILVGEKTFGKGTVQIVKDFPDRSALRVTTSQWLLPDETSIDREGLTPDILEARRGINETEDSQLLKAIEALQSTR